MNDGMGGTGMSRKRLLPNLAAARAAARVLDRLRRERSGSYSMIVALLLPVIIGFVSLGTEVGLWFYDQQAQQTAADNAAYSAAVNYLANNSIATAQTQAIAVASYQGYGTSSTAGSLTCTGTTATTSTCTTSSGTTCNISAPAVGTVCVQVDTPPLYGANANASCGSTCYFEVIVAQRPQQLFSAALFNNPVIIEAIAVGRAGNVNCIIALNKSFTGYATGVPGAVTNSGGAAQTLTTCSIAIASKAANSFVVSGGSITTSAVYNAGTESGAGTLTATTNDESYTGAITDPYSSIGVPTCGGTCSACTKSTGGTTTGAVSLSSGALTLTPPTTGASAGICTIGGAVSVTGGTLTLASGGTYVIDGSLTVATGLAAATLTGSNVTIILTKNTSGSYGVIDFAKGTVTLTAPTSGTYAGVAIYQDRNASSSTYTISGSSTQCSGSACNTIACSSCTSTTFSVSIDGAIYTPSEALQFAGGTSGAACTQLIADTINFSGTAAETLKGNCSGGGTSSPAQLVN
jgi:Flp pilus assembly protein TadG